jgi:hypothetical protein
MSMRAKVESLERAMQSFDPVELPLRHYFANGLYAREMTVPAGVTLTGAVHRTTHLCILSKGRVHVATEDGVLDLIAPATLVAHPGAKRAIHAVEDSVWTNVHATTETDLDKLVEELTESTAAQLQGGASNPQQLACDARKQVENF